jgi:hypothetical protein
MLVVGSKYANVKLPLRSATASPELGPSLGVQAVRRPTESRSASAPPATLRDILFDPFNIELS